MGKPQVIMLSDAIPVLFAATTDAGLAQRFYCGILGLRRVADTPFALVLQSGSVVLRLQKVPAFVPQPFTALGWQVSDLAAIVAGLGAAGVDLARFDSLGQDADGIWTTPDRTRIAWFHDPDGNLLSLTEPG